MAKQARSPRKYCVGTKPNGTSCKRYKTAEVGDDTPFACCKGHQPKPTLKPTPPDVVTGDEETLQPRLIRSQKRKADEDLFPDAQCLIEKRQEEEVRRIQALEAVRETIATPLPLPPRASLLGVPTELRQQIVAETLTVRLGKPAKPLDGRTSIRRSGHVVSTPLGGVCQSLCADFKEVVESWLPNPINGSLEPLITPRQLQALKKFTRYYRRCAKKSNRSDQWPGIEELTIRLVKEFSSEEVWGRYTREHTPIDIDWVNRITELPDKIKILNIDLTVSRSQLRWLEESEPGGTIGPHNYEFGTRIGLTTPQYHWLNYFTKVRNTVSTIVSRHWESHGRPSRPETFKKAGMFGTDQLFLNPIGKLPQSQVDVLVYLPRHAQRFWDDDSEWNGWFFCDFLAEAKAKHTRLKLERLAFRREQKKDRLKDFREKEENKKGRVQLKDYNAWAKKWMKVVEAANKGSYTKSSSTSSFPEETRKTEKRKREMHDDLAEDTQLTKHPRLESPVSPPLPAADVTHTANDKRKREVDEDPGEHFRPRKLLRQSPGLAPAEERKKVAAEDKEDTLPIEVVHQSPAPPLPATTDNVQNAKRKRQDEEDSSVLPEPSFKRHRNDEGRNEVGTAQFSLPSLLLSPPSLALTPKEVARIGRVAAQDVDTSPAKTRIQPDERESRLAKHPFTLRKPPRLWSWRQRKRRARANAL